MHLRESGNRPHRWAEARLAGLVSPDRAARGSEPIDMQSPRALPAERYGDGFKKFQTEGFVVR